MIPAPDTRAEARRDLLERELDREKVILAWSGGKDSALTLRELQMAADYEVVTLLTTVTEGYDRISMHGVRRALLEQQAHALGLPVEVVFIPRICSNEEYGNRMREVLEQYCAAGVRSIAFGDVFLEDVRAYREDNLARVGMRGVFPLWKRNPADLARAFVGLGFKAVITCVDSQMLDGGFVGRAFDERFLAELPPTVDPCGENGAFHSFVYDGPMFQMPVLYEKGETVLRDDRFYFCDLVPVQDREGGAT
jgi:uncharacterized protein (TIGR00290 family)